MGAVAAIALVPLLIPTDSAAAPSRPSVRLWGSQVSQPKNGAFVSRGKFGLARLKANVSCAPGTKVGRIRITSMAGLTPWKNSAPNAQSWRGGATFTNVPLQRGKEARRLCEPNAHKPVTRDIPYEVEWECSGKGRRAQKNVKMDLNCKQFEKQTRVRPVRFIHTCAPGYVIKGTSRRSIETTQGPNNPRICTRKR